MKKVTWMILIFAIMIIGCNPILSTTRPSSIQSLGTGVTITRSPSPVSSATSVPTTIQPTSSATTPPNDQSTLSITTSPGIPTADGEAVSAISLLTPTIAPASEIIDTAHISSFFLQHAAPLTIAIDDKYVYWVDRNDPSILYKISQSGGTPEVVATSLYPQGRLDCIDLQASAHWLILCDTDTPGIPGNWKVRAIHLDDLSQRVLLTSVDNAPFVLSSFGISLDENSVFWACTTIKDNQLDENVVTFVNLDTGESHELLRKKADTLATWMLSLSGDQAVIQQAFSESPGVKDVLQLFDITSGKMNDLLTDEGSFWPWFSFPWVIWMQQGYQGYMQTFVVYNLIDGRRARVPGTGQSPDKPKIAGSRVYWKDQGTSKAGNAIYIYDIGKNTTYILQTPGPDQFYRAVYIHNQTIAWVRNTEFSKAESNYYLEWTTIQ
jgi:hypothetical protein